MQSKKALSPLVATLLLVVFALIIGTATMSWGNNYVDNLEEETTSSSIVISLDDIDTPLKELQIKYITNRITLEEYFEQEENLR